MYNRSTALFGGIGDFWERLASWYQTSFLSEFLAYVSERYYHVEFGAYEHFSFGADANQTAEMLIVALAFGVIIAAIAVAYTKRKLGKFVEKLMSSECFSPESAKTLYELGYFRSSAIRRELTKGVVLRKNVYKVLTVGDPIEAPPVPALEDDGGAEASRGDEEHKEKETAPRSALDDKKIDFINTRFYIPEELKYHVEVRFERKGSGWIPVLITAIGALVGAAAVCRFLPSFIGLLDNLISLMAP